jgi:hypothetical protein
VRSIVPSYMPNFTQYYNPPKKKVLREKKNPSSTS